VVPGVDAVKFGCPSTKDASWPVRKCPSIGRKPRALWQPESATIKFPFGVIVTDVGRPKDEAVHDPSPVPVTLFTPIAISALEDEFTGLLKMYTALCKI